MRLGGGSGGPAVRDGRGLGRGQVGDGSSSCRRIAGGGSAVSSAVAVRMGRRIGGSLCLAEGQPCRRE